MTGNIFQLKAVTSNLLVNRIIILSEYFQTCVMYVTATHAGFPISTFLSLSDMREKSELVFTFTQQSNIPNSWSYHELANITWFRDLWLQRKVKMMVQSSDRIKNNETYQVPWLWKSSSASYSELGRDSSVPGCVDNLIRKSVIQVHILVLLVQESSRLEKRNVRWALGWFWPALLSSVNMYWPFVFARWII